MWARHPKIAREFEEKTPKGADLPERIGKAHSKSYYDKAIKKRRKK
jgi:hypothetical protein